MKINDYDHIFWDFDGVIKDSLEIKTQAFYDLFLEFGQEIANKVKEHHILNSGVSRYEKMPIYLKWSNQEVSSENIDLFLSSFKEKVVDKVVKSPWVPGSKDFLKDNIYNQNFYLVTATPQDEIQDILKKINLSDSFVDCFGSPKKKQEAIMETILKYKLVKSRCIMIGDAVADLEAAKKNNISFLLRQHEYNNHMSLDLETNFKISDLTEL